MSEVAVGPVQFARWLGIEPFPHQVPALESTAANVVPAGGRRSGKTEASIIKALSVLLGRDGVDWIVTGPSEDKAREYLERVMAILRASPHGMRAVEEEQALLIRFRNGSRMLGIVGTGAKLRGPGNRLFGATIEEPGFSRPDAFSALRYALLDHRAEGSQLWMPGSPWGGDTHPFRVAHQRGLDGDPDYASFTWPTSLNPKIPKEWIERERGRVSSIEAAAELDGLWRTGGEDGQIFPPSLLETCTAPGLVVPDLLAYAGPARPSIGLDFGLEFDSTVASAAFRVPGPDGVPRLLVTQHAWPLHTRANTIVDDVAAIRLPAGGWVAPEKNGIGLFAVAELRHQFRARRNVRWCTISTTAPLKWAGYSALLWLLEQGQIVLPAEPDLLRQMAGIRMQPPESGPPRLEAGDPAVHDDRVDALVWSLMPRRRSCVMTGWLRGPRMVPDAVVPELDCPTVTTGAGVVLPETPAVQSVDGPGVTYPEGVGQRDTFAAMASAAPVDPRWAETRRLVTASLAAAGMTGSTPDDLNTTTVATDPGATTMED